MSQDSMDWTPGECLRKAAEQADREDVDAVVVVMLSRGKDGNDYNTFLRNAGLRNSEMLSLLAVAHFDVVNMMRGK